MSVCGAGESNSAASRLILGKKNPYFAMGVGTVSCANHDPRPPTGSAYKRRNDPTCFNH